MNNDWEVTILFPDMPADADADSIKIMVDALLNSNGLVPYEIARIEKRNND